MTELATHWADVWGGKQPNETSWFQHSPEPCSRLVRSVSTPESRVALVGVGASLLVADLLAHGYRQLEAIDVSGAALDRLRAQLGAAAGRVRLREADACTVGFDEPVDIWHDRATFHFLTDPADRAAYAASAASAVRAGGHAVVATFDFDGPEQCSGLPVVRYEATTLAAEFAGGFELVDTADHVHTTPWGTPQPFVYVVLRRLTTGELGELGVL
jgi:SAM-dependent methyltransferase